MVFYLKFTESRVGMKYIRYDVSSSHRTEFRDLLLVEDWVVREDLYSEGFYRK